MSISWKCIPFCAFVVIISQGNRNVKKNQIGIYRAANALPFGEGGPKGRERFSCKYAPSAHLFRQKSKIFATFPRGEGIAPAALKRTTN
jgi:hypothetical protein